MGFMIGSPCYLQVPISDSQSRIPFLCVSFNVRNAGTKRRRRSFIRPPMASLNHEEGPNDDVSSKRRTVLLVGVSMLPLLQLRAEALEGSTLRRERPRKNKIREEEEEEGTRVLPMEVASEQTVVNKPEENQIAESELKNPEESQKPEEARAESPSNPFLSLLNGLGVFGAGVLGALYALVQKEKKANT